ncbi:CYFA0S23e00474g1_1 [Cyberlindnera fabianii]|uniref:CYFA0S23e00474g1_1 n=1 Tax=Cyberlindnera fabianii TaxID=36022 RepID=A0A061BHC7_CYBFA|nr:hypothetical protein BON22_4303 [Cyberlindnera fabianii]CDR46387.1 CYFA0S23e00474g1_1 [Cyberlindnera fabianii]
MRYVYDYEMYSPLNSPFHSDGLGMNYATDYPGSTQTAKFEKKLVLHYIINHSFNLLFEGYAEKLQLEINEKTQVELIQFTVALFKRLELSLQNFQKLLLLLNRYFTKLGSEKLQLSVKQVVLGLLVQIVGITSTNWHSVTGLPLNSVHALVRYIDADLDEEDYDFSNEELEMINDKMKSLIYSRFDVI